MAGFSTAEVRAFLDEIDTGRPTGSARPELFQDLRVKGALAGSPSAPQITPVGRHVLRELALRSYRADGLELDTVSAEMSYLFTEIDRIARAAEYFLGDVGPLASIDSLPYMRITSAAMVSSGTAPDELAESFRNIFGMLEVLGGRGADRLLASEMLVGSIVPMSRLYAPINNTLIVLRSKGAATAQPVATAALLHLHPAPTPEAPIAAWSTWRAHVGSDLVAAALAGTRASEAAFDGLRSSLQAEGATPAESEQAAAYLLATRTDDPPIARTLALAQLLRGLLPTPYVAAALLTARHALSPEELADWVEKAAPVAETRRLAPTPAERRAVAVALVHGLDPNAFHWSAARPTPAAPGETVAATAALPMLALHAWVFRVFVEPSAPPPSRPAAVGAA